MIYTVKLWNNKNSSKSKGFFDIDEARGFIEDLSSQHKFEFAEIYKGEAFVEAYDKGGKRLPKKAAAKESIQRSGGSSSAIESIIKASKEEIDLLEMDSRDPFTEGTELELMQDYSPIMRQISANDDRIRTIFEDPHFEAEGEDSSRLLDDIREDIITSLADVATNIISKYRAYFDADIADAVHTLSEFMALAKDQIEYNLS